MKQSRVARLPAGEIGNSLNRSISRVHHCFQFCDKNMPGLLKEQRSHEGLKKSIKLLLTDLNLLAYDSRTASTLHILVTEQIYFSGKISWAALFSRLRDGSIIGVGGSFFSDYFLSQEGHCDKCAATKLSIRLLRRRLAVITEKHRLQCGRVLTAPLKNSLTFCNGNRDSSFVWIAANARQLKLLILHVVPHLQTACTFPQGGECI